MKLVLLGLPGSGKGTQATQIGQVLNIPHISTGDIFRWAVRDKTCLGLEAKSYMERGQLVPDHITTGIIEDRLAKDDCVKGFLLDGFPRTLPQAEALDTLLNDLGKSFFQVIYIDVSEEELVKRLTGRLMCRECGATYHLSLSVPRLKNLCDQCQGLLYQREDDRLETVATRLKINLKETKFLIEYYKNKGNLIQIDGQQPIEKVTELIFRTLGVR